ncbi:MAG: substrate-binding domain-containing protein [Actinobacteria bacterium]|nr:substrate-binding domain-containing protein [Actinomycetota bacterium]
MYYRLEQVIAAAVLTLMFAACGNGGRESVILATTTSTQDSGLLDELIPAFERESGLQVKTIAVGSGEAIELGARGEADVVLAHSPAAEEKLMAAGKGGERRTVMHNDFVIVGSATDPAKIRDAEPADALARIAVAKAPFVSRGDDSGTHTFELELWEGAGSVPGGAWYQESGQGMGATLQIANDKDAYTISDRGTYLATESARELEIIVEGGGELLNVYHVIDIAADAGERVNAEGGKALADWLVSSAAQQSIETFGVKRFGEPLFVPDAGKTDQQILAAA